MNTSTHFDPWRDKHAINMEPEKMDKFSEEDSLFFGHSSENQRAVAEALEHLPNERYRRLLIGLYREHCSPQLMAEELEVSLPNLYNLHRRALASLKARMESQKAVTALFDVVNN